MQHPQSDKKFLMHCIRSHILRCKQRFGTARSLVHYRVLIATYKTAKKENKLNESSHV